MKTPYIPHLFAESAQSKLQAHRGWLTIGVDSSIAWPQQDVWLFYDGQEYVLRGAKDADAKQRPPCISTPCLRNDIDTATTRLYKFASVLGWFKGGHVDVTGSVWGSGPVLYGSRDTFTTTLEGGKYFNCNYMPVIEDEQIRKALAFFREGRRLQHIHEPYSFLSFFKVLESQFNSKDRVAWIQTNLDQLDGDAAHRVTKLRAEGVDVSKHLYESGRSAVAHASFGGIIVDPDVPADRRRISDDLDIMAALAARYLKDNVGIPDEMELYRTRDRTEPWHVLLPRDTLLRLRNREAVSNPALLGRLQQTKVSVRLWPNEAPEPMKGMTLVADGYGPGVVTLLAHNSRATIFLRFALDIANGRLHILLDDGGISEQFNSATEADIEHYTRYFHSVISNAMVELCIEELDPVPCEVVIPVNIIPQAPETMVSLALEQFRQRHDGK